MIHRSHVVSTYYPELTEDNNKISSFLELIIILPLLDITSLYDVLQRVSGSTYEYEEYISDKLTDIWDNVPDSPQKKHAEEELALIRTIRNGEYNEELICNIQNHRECYQAYQELLQRKLKIYIDLQLFVREYYQTNQQE